MDTWLSTESRGGLLIKIEVYDRKGGAIARVRPATAAAGSGKQVWLSDIKESARGFTGVVCLIQTPLQHIPLGRRVAFDPTHILDWTISYKASPPTDPALPFCETKGA